MSTTRNLMTVCCLLVFAVPTAFAQGGGGFGGGGYSSGSYSNKNSWYANRSENAAMFLRSTNQNTESTLNVIAITGSAEKRLTPEKLRLVIAITTEEETAKECRDKLANQIATIQKDWKENLKITNAEIAQDFIALLPVYDLIIDKSYNSPYRRKQTGYRLQVNLHVSLKTDTEASIAIGHALEYADANVVTFEYWHSELDEARKEVMKRAMSEAKTKSEVMLSVFEDSPPVINIDENTQVFFPTSQYQTYSNSLTTGRDHYWNDNKLADAKSKFTFLRGLQSDSDTRPREMMMRPQIVVASSVNLYFQSPAKARLETRENPRR